MAKGNGQSITRLPDCPIARLPDCPIARLPITRLPILRLASGSITRLPISLPLPITRLHIADAGFN
jgi:hypothetical protein